MSEKEDIEDIFFCFAANICKYDMKTILLILLFK